MAHRQTSKLILLLLLLLTAAPPASAIAPSKQLALCRLDTWGIRDGLPGYDITALTQTPDGYIWIGTTQGLLRFDGTSFTVFDRHNVPGLTNTTIRGLGVDNLGNLLIGAEWCGYGRLIGGKYVRSQFPDERWNATRLFHTSPDGSLWVGYQGYAYVLRERDGIVQKISVPNGLNMSGIADLPHGDELVSTIFGGLYIISEIGVVRPFVASPAIAENDFTCMAQMPDGSIWIGTDTHGIYRVNDGHSTHLTTQNGLASDTIHCLYVDSHKRLWIGTNNGIETPLGSSFAHFSANDGLGSDNVSSILEDREGDLWVASGLYLNRFAETRFTPVGFGKGMMDQIEQMSVSDGALMCGTRNGLWSLAPSNNYEAVRLTNFPVDGAVTLRNGDLVVWRKRNASSSEIGTVHAGKLLSTKEIHYGPLTVIPDGKGVDIYGVMGWFQHFDVDAQNNLASSSGRRKLFPRLDEIQIFDIKPAGDGSLWLGTDHGLALCGNGHAHLLNLPLPANAHVLCIDATMPRQLWLAMDKGLCRVDVNPLGTYKVKVYTKNDGLPSDELLQVLRDDQGSLWIGGYFGIFDVSLFNIDAFDRGSAHTLMLRTHGSSDGIRSYPRIGSPTKTRDGKLWFVGRRGLTEIDPLHQVENALPPPVQIEEAVASGTSLNQDRQTRVAPGDGSFLVRYAGLSYVEPEQVRFKIRLEGFDTGRIDVGGKRVANYTNLPPGTYTFRVVACNNARVWNMTGASIRFVLLPHFYQTLWFRLLLAMLAVVAAVGLIVLRTRNVMQRARELEAKVAQRTAELIEANSQLTEFEEELRLQNVELKDAQASVEVQNEELHAMQAELMAQNDELQSVQAELESQNQEMLEAQDRLTEANKQLEALATTDGLTGLFNHRMFHEQLEQEWSRHARYGTALSVILIDVDKFKLYNDSHGHPAGDVVLRKVAEILQATARRSDVVARYGGEEFVIIARETDIRAAVKLAERLRVAIESVDWPLRPITASLGVSSADPSTTYPADLVAQADAALYRSKNNGRNSVTHYRDPEPTTTA